VSYGETFLLSAFVCDA